MRECADAVPRAVHRAAREKRTGQTAAGAHGGTSPVPLKPHILTFPSGAEQRPHREGTRVNPRISSWTNIGPWSTVHPYSSQLWSLCAGPPLVRRRSTGARSRREYSRFEPGSRSGGAGGPPQSVRSHPPGGPLSASPASGFGSNATRQHRSGAAGPERGRERGAPRSPYFRFLILSHVLSVRACGVGPVTRASRIRVAVPTERSHRRGKSKPKPLRPAGFRIVRGFALHPAIVIMRRLTGDTD